MSSLGLIAYRDPGCSGGEGGEGKGKGGAGGSGGGCGSCGGEEGEGSDGGSGEGGGDDAWPRMVTVGGEETAVAEMLGGKSRRVRASSPKNTNEINSLAFPTVKFVNMFTIPAVEDGPWVLAISWAVPGGSCTVLTVSATSSGSGLITDDRRRYNPACLANSASIG